MLLKTGSRGNDVKQLQQKLGIAADGIFGPGTEQAVKNWQAKNGLHADGKVGPLTWGKLFDVPSYSDLSSADLSEDNTHSSTDDTDTEASSAVGSVDGLNLDLLDGHIPTTVIAQIPLCASTFALNTRLRLAHFLAQCAHESGNFKFTTENLNYSAEGLSKIFGRYFPGNLATSYARQPQKIAARVYANRMGNGDEASQDGWKYRGRGYIQLTGKENYTAFSHSVSDDILANPDLVASKYPLLSAAWFWNSRQLNALADGGEGDDVVTAITKKVNGGTNGLADRIEHFKAFYAALA